MTVANLIGSLTGIVALAGCVQSGLGAMLIRRFRRTERRAIPHRGAMPPITVLKPLHGDEPLLEDALDSFCRQDYPEFQIVFGVQRTDDAAIAIVRRLQARYPRLHLDLVIDTRSHGLNRKVGNLINMYPSARHDVLVMSDSDIHVSRDYLRRTAEALVKPGAGLVTTLYAGLPATGDMVRRLAACQINHNFLPGVILSRYLGRQDCLGATMALTRQTLERIGGLNALVEHVADDAILGQAVRKLGLTIEIATCMTWTTIAETSMTDLLAHELRWGRTVKNVEPFGYALSSIQLPLFWAGVTLLCAPAAPWAWGVFLSTWTLRAIFSLIVDRALGQPSIGIVPLLPLRDWMSAAVMVGSARGTQVAWRGQTMHIIRHSTMTQSEQPVGPGK